MPDIYYSPEDFGLALIWSFEEDLSYAFDITAVWGSPLSGAVYVANDSGCSCPSPFEEYTSLESVNELTRIDVTPGREAANVKRAVLDKLYVTYDTDSAMTAKKQQLASNAADAVTDWLTNQRKAVTA